MENSLMHTTPPFLPRDELRLKTGSSKVVVLEIQWFDEKEIEVVTPYTVELTALGKNGHSCHVVAKKGELAKNDVLLELDSGTLFRVTKPDSKCLSPRGNKSKWMKIPAEFIEFTGE